MNKLAIAAGALAVAYLIATRTTQGKALVAKLRGPCCAGCAGASKQAGDTSTAGASSSSAAAPAALALDEPSEDAFYAKPAYAPDPVRVRTCG